MSDTKKVYKDYLAGKATLEQLGESAQETLQHAGLIPRQATDAPTTERRGDAKPRPSS